MHKNTLILVSLLIITNCSIESQKCTKDDTLKLVSAGFTKEEISDICDNEDNNNNNDMLDNKADYEGVYIKIESKNTRYGIYTFDLNTTFIIEKNGRQYLVINDEGDESRVPINKGKLQITDNCNLSFDQNNQVLTKKCITGSSPISEEFWPKIKVDEYLEKPKHEIAYDQYVNSVIYDLYQDRYQVPDLDDLRLDDFAKENFVKDSILRLNGFYPIATFGDFNGDNKLPDIAIIIKNVRVDNLSTVNGSKLIVIHAGFSAPVEIEKKLCNWIEKETSRKLESHWEDKVVKKNSDGILNVCLEKSAVVHYWNGFTYKQFWVSD